MWNELESLLKEISNCKHCVTFLPLGPNPVVIAQASAKILIIGQAPGTKVHESGIPWDDASGKRLRSWMDIDDDVFYDASKIAIVPMGFCYPGKGKSGDLPPRKECAPLWHQHLIDHLPNLKLTMLVGQYAQRYYLKDKRKRTLTDTVKAFKEYLPTYFPLVHPSPRNQIWLKKNSWFEKELLPELQQQVRIILKG